MLQRKLKKSLQKAIKKAGTQTDLALLIGESQQSISYWLKHSVGGVSAGAAVKIEAATGVSRYDLVKDAELIWGPAPKKAAAA